MKKLKMLVTARFARRELEKVRDHLSEVEFAGYGVTGEIMPEGELISALRGVDLFVHEFESVTRRVIEASPALTLVGCCRTGPEASVDLAAATEHGIPVLYTPGRNAVSVAEYTIGLMIGLTRHIAKAHHLLRYTSELTQVSYVDKSPERLGITSEWSLDPSAPFNLLQGPELYGKTLGLVGFGAIGREIASRARAFGMEIATYDPFIPAEAAGALHARRLSLEELAAESDLFAMAAKVTPQTVGMVSRSVLARMKPTAYFVNTARAALVDYDALYEMLKERRIAGAALDVYPTEPISEEDRFRTLDNVLLSPHLAGASFDIPQHHSRLMVEAVAAALAGERPRAVANPEAWERRRLGRDAASGEAGGPTEPQDEGPSGRARRG